MGPVRQNQIQRTVRSVHVCVCIALCTTVAHNIGQNRTELIIFPLTLQTTTIAQHPQKELDDFIEVKFYCTYALAHSK